MRCSPDNVRAPGVRAARTRSNSRALTPAARARAAAALVLAATTAGAQAQSSYFSATGTFAAAADAAQRFVVDFHNAGETNSRTWAWGGGVNAAGTTIPNNGIDSALWFNHRAESIPL